MQQPAGEPQVLGAGEYPVDGGVLAGDADQSPDRIGGLSQIVLEDLDIAAIGQAQGRQDADQRGLARAVGAEKGEDGARADVEVEVVQDYVGAEGFA